MFHPAAPRLLLRLVGLQRKKGEAPHSLVPMETDHYRRLPIYLDHVLLTGLYQCQKCDNIDDSQHTSKGQNLFSYIIRLLSKRDILRFKQRISQNLTRTLTIKFVGSMFYNIPIPKILFKWFCLETWLCLTCISLLHGSL